MVGPTGGIQEKPLRRHTGMFGIAFMSRTEKTSGRIDPATPISECRYVVLDTELTGLNPKKDSIISIGAIAMTGSRIHLGPTFYEMVSPRTELRSENVVIHGIMPSEVVGKPRIGDVIEDFLSFCEGAVLVGHFVGLDLLFLNRELKEMQGRGITHPAVDTMRIHEWIRSQDNAFSRHFAGSDENRDLFTLAGKYHISVSEAHNALMDAFTAAQLFQRFLSILPSTGVRTMKDLLTIGKP